MRIIAAAALSAFTLLILALPGCMQRLVAPDAPPAATAARDAELNRRATALIEAFSNGSPAFTPDDNQVVFVSNRTGLPQLYVAPSRDAKAEARRVLDWPERVDEPHPTPDGKAVIFRSDKGADENWRYYRVNLDGTGLVELTPGEPLNRDLPFQPELAPGTLYFSARTMKSPETSVYAISATAASEPKLIHRYEKPGFLYDVSRDGKQALFLRFPSRSENYLVHLDTATGEARQLYPQTGRISIAAARFAPDGRRVYIATDLGGEEAVVLALDTKSGRELARYVEKNPKTAQITGLAVSKVRNRIAVSLNAGEHSELRLLDATTLEPLRELRMPLGLGGASEFSNDGSRLAVTWSTPNRPGDIFAIGASSGTVKPLRTEPRPTLVGLPQIDTTVAHIKSHDGLTIPINVYRAHGQSGRKPVIVTYHGGPAAVSAIRWSPQIAFYVSLGYAYVEPNVRGSTGFGRAYEEGDNGPGRLEAFKDIEATARWVAQQPWADKDRLVIFGGSYGGYSTLIGLTRQADLWRAGVNLFGVVDLKTFMASTTGLIREIFHLEFGHPERDAAFLESISPLRDVDKIVDPTFVYAGANDPRVPRSESDQIVAALRKKGVPVEYMVKDNEGHSLARRENQAEFLARSARFLETYLQR